MDEKTSNRTLAESTEDEIVQLILDQNMKVGEKLPNEFDLARQLGVGRSTLREAIRHLAARNVLEVRQGAGTFISNKRGVPEDPLGLTFVGRDPALALELMDIRLMLEPEVCAIVAQRVTPEQMEQLQNYAREISRLAESGQDYSEPDAQMHRYLAECSGNRVLRNVIPIFTSSVGVSIAATNDEYRLATSKEHQAIADAICRRDSTGARCAMIVHLNTTRNAVARQVAGQVSRDR